MAPLLLTNKAAAEGVCSAPGSIGKLSAMGDLPKILDNGGNLPEW